MPTSLKDLLAKYVATHGPADGEGEQPDKDKYTSAGLGPVLDPTTFDLRYTSPSQMERFDSESEGGCERKWWFRYRARMKDRRTKAKDLGTQVHAQLEHYLKTGEEVLGELVMAGRNFIPAPGPDLLVESEHGVPEWPGPVEAPIVSILRQAGVPLVLKIDLMHRRGTFLTEEGLLVPEPGITAEVRDWKTSKQIDDVYDEMTGLRQRRGYAKKGPDLIDTWQMPSYGEVARLLWPDITHVRLSHGYFQSQRERRGALRSSLHTVDEVVARWRQGEALVERMKVVAKTDRVEDIPANGRSCEAFGGCSYKGQCPRDPRAMLEQLVGGGAAARLLTKDKTAPIKREVPMSLLDKFKKGQAGQAAAAADPLAAEKAKLLAEEQAIKAGGQSITPPDVPPPSESAKVSGQTVTASCGHVVPVEVTSRLTDGAIKHIGCKGAEAAVPAAQAAAAKTEMEQLQTRPGEQCPYTGSQIDCTVKQVATKKYDCVCGEKALKIKPEEMGEGYCAIVPKHKVPGEPPKTTEPEKPAETVNASPADVLRPNDRHGQITLAPADSGKRVDLYASSIEDGVAYKRLESYAQGLADRLAEQFKVPDVRAAVGDSPVSFGKWKGILTAMAKAEPPAPGAYLVDAQNDFGMVVFEALATMNLGRVVRGIK